MTFLHFAGWLSIWFLLIAGVLQLRTALECSGPVARAGLCLLIFFALGYHIAAPAL